MARPVSRRRLVSDGCELGRSAPSRGEAFDLLCTCRRLHADALHAERPNGYVANRQEWESPPVVMAEMGHTSPTLALKVYAQTMRRSEDEQAQPAALMDGEKERKGTKAEVVPIAQAKGRAA
jgi:hypothetical protein